MLSPSTSAALCQSLVGCVKDPSGNFNLDGMALDCKREPSGAPPDSAFTPSEPAPPASGVRATSLVNIVASEEGATQLGATYLVAELAEGRCIVDSVLSWAGSYADTEAATRWESPAEAPARLHVRAHRTTFTVLDQEELERGEPNVASEVCARRSYEVASGRFTLLEHTEAASACAGMP